MAGLVGEFRKAGVDPLDVVERFAARHGWICDRAGEAEIVIELSGEWCGYRIFVSLHPEAELLLFAFAFDTRARHRKADRLYPLLAIINERLLIGHFDLWTGHELPVFRHTVLLRGHGNVGSEQLEGIFDIALAECERYYPAFQFVIWAGKSPREAIEAAILETVGEA